jgi:hypothetical protein
MNSKTIIVILALILGGITGAYLHKKFSYPAPQPSQLKLEEILSIKELHLVRYMYKDLFFLHRKNDPDKAIRAIVEVPVSITAYINLKEIEVVKHNDSIKAVILPKAYVNAPAYEVNKMVIKKTRTFQLHAGSDLYPEVTQYLQQATSQRMDTVRAMAIENKILQQAEKEAKDYIKSMLRAVGRNDINVLFSESKSSKPIKVSKPEPNSGLTMKAEFVNIDYIIERLIVE